MDKYLNGKAEAAIRKATSASLGIPEKDVTPELFAQQEQEAARRRRQADAQFRAKFQAWARNKTPRENQP